MDEFALRPEGTKERVWDFPIIPRSASQRQLLSQTGITGFIEVMAG
jgi:hypothetical protein